LITQRQKNYKVGMVEAYFDYQKEKIIFSDADHPETGIG
jgi:hypothetical protein